MFEAIRILKSKEAIRLLSALMAVTPIRKKALKTVEKKFYRAYVEENIRFPKKVQEDKFMMARNMMWAISRAIERGNISKAVLPKFLSTFGNVWLYGSFNRAKFREEHGIDPPVFLTISPTKFCNLQCTGCYASSSKSAEEKLPYDIVNRIVAEKTKLWGSHFTVLSGGEPLLYKSDGKTVIDLDGNSRTEADDVEERTRIDKLKRTFHHRFLELWHSQQRLHFRRQGGKRLSLYRLERQRFSLRIQSVLHSQHRRNLSERRQFEHRAFYAFHGNYPQVASQLHSLKAAFKVGKHSSSMRHPRPFSHDASHYQAAQRQRR
jgi:hypothetical protein